VLSVVVGACGGDARNRPLRATELVGPAPPGSSVPNLVLGSGRLYLSWIETSEEAPPQLRIAVRDAGEWSAPHTLASGDRLLVNWADFPSMAVSDRGRLAAQWLELAGGNSFAYGARFSTAERFDGPWSEPVKPHGGDVAGDYGFVTLIPEVGDRIGAIWLDGREMRAKPARMSLRYRAWADGRFGETIVLDPDVCTCCQTAAVAVEGDVLVAYRDHAPSEVRDISLVKRRGESWSDPQTLHADGWEIAACPVNGPALATRGRRVAVAWFTAAAAEPRVLVAFSDDAGDHFGEPLRVDGGGPLGRVDLAMATDGSTLISWLEQVEGGAELSVRHVDEQGVAGPRLGVGVTDAGRPSGFPRLVGDGERFYLAWTVPGVASEVRLATIRLADR
jgi:hypothetical protein